MIAFIASITPVNILKCWMILSWKLLIPLDRTVFFYLNVFDSIDVGLVQHIVLRNEGARLTISALFCVCYESVLRLPSCLQTPASRTPARFCVWQIANYDHLAHSPISPHISINKPLAEALETTKGFSENKKVYIGRKFHK